MVKVKSTSLLLAGLVILALVVLASVPFFLARQTSARAVEAAQARAVIEAERASANQWVYTALDGELRFADIDAQSREFMGYYYSIELTPEQEAIKKEVLEAMPAACCDNSNAYTCCCPCNLSKTVWGLSNYVLTEKAADAQQLREVVENWMKATNERGYSGDACHTGGCQRKFSDDGCGGMHDAELVV